MPATTISRRQLLTGMAGLTGLALTPGLLATCATNRGTAAPSGVTTSLGSNFADPVPKAAMQKVLDAFTAESGIAVAVNTHDARSFQDQISTYLQGDPDDAFTWFGGQRMRFFADQGLVADLSDVWETIGSSYGDAFRVASTGSDGKQYLVPFHTYPWVVMYRRSVWEDGGYQPPTTYDELLALAVRMQDDDLVPFAFGDRDGWPAMGTFDILDMRLNGYDFHIRLADGEEQWTDQRVAHVFETWRELLPYHQRGALGRTWQEAARSLIAGEAAMYFAGTFAGEQATEEERADLDFFPFPGLGTEFDDELAIDAPINGFMMSPDAKEPEAARALLTYLGKGPAQVMYVSENPNRVAAALDAETSGYTDFQVKMERVISGAGRLAQFLDRDSRPDFTGPTGMQAFLQDFLSDPDQDLEPFLGGIQAFWDELP